jgi:hypothetical protein
MTQTILNLGTGGAVLNGQNGSTAGADSNDALFLDWPGDNQGNYVYLPGVAGNAMSVPDEAALDITGDIDIRVRVAMDDWTPASSQRFLSKANSNTPVWGYLLNLNTNGTLVFAYSTTGSDLVQVLSTAATGLTDGSVKWVRATFDVDNGSSQNEVKFFLSDDGVTWTQLGSTVTNAGTVTMNANANVLAIGSDASTAFGVPSAGKFYRAQVLNGIGGTVVLDVDTSVITTSAATSFTAVTGQTVTINRSTTGRKSVAVCQPTWLFGTNNFMQVANNALLNFTTSEPFSVVYAYRVWATPGNFTFLFAKRITTSDSFDPTRIGYGARMLGTSSQFWQVNSETHYVTASRTSLSAGFRAGVMRYGGLGTGAVTHFLGGTTATATLSGGTTLTNSLPFRVGANSAVTPGEFGEFELYGLAVFRRLITDAERDAVVTYFTNRIK